MESYIHYFETNTAFQDAYNGENYHEPWVSLTNENSNVNYNKSEYQKLLETPLTFVIQSDGAVVFENANYIDFTIEHKKNDGEWIESTITSGNGLTISVVSGDTVQFRGNNATYCESYGCQFQNSSCLFNLEGNIMSLINSTNFSSLTTLQSGDTFTNLFYNCTGLTSASDLLLPATTLFDNCYSSMFYDCTSLTETPELPATTLAQSCYSSMFYGCSGLTQAPVLPATTLSPYCYAGMFGGCTSLTSVPVLPATTLAVGCYQYMFQNCTNLVQAPELPATTLTNYCYFYMFNGCTNLNYIKCLATDISTSFCTANWVSGVAATGTFVKSASTDWSSKTGTDGIPTGWTIQDAG